MTRLISHYETYVNAKETRHSVEVIGITGHADDLWNDRVLCPLWSELLNQLLQILRGGLSNSKYMVHQPSHAEGIQLLIKELNSKLSSQEWHVLNDRQTNSPLRILSQFNNCREKGL